MDKEQMAEPAKPYEFRAKPAWQRLIVMVAGVVMNLVMAVVIYIGISYTWGESYVVADSARWGYNFNEAAEKLGFIDGDVVLAIDGKEIEDTSEIATTLLLSDSDRTVSLIRNTRPQTITISLEDIITMRKEKRYANLYSLRMPFIINSVVAEGPVQQLQEGDEVISVNNIYKGDFPEYAAELKKNSGGSVRMTILRQSKRSARRERISYVIPVSEEGKIGVMTRDPFEVRTRSYTFMEAIPAGFKRAGATIKSYWQQLSLIFQPKTEMYRELGGFMAIGSMFSSVWDWQDFWVKTAFLSIILAVMNILPIPGLDGGHSLFAIYEIVTRRKPSEKFLEVAQYIGMAIIFALMIYANGNDIVRFIFN